MHVCVHPLFLHRAEMAQGAVIDGSCRLVSDTLPSFIALASARQIATTTVFSSISRLARTVGVYLDGGIRILV